MCAHLMIKQIQRHLRILLCNKSFLFFQRQECVSPEHQDGLLCATERKTKTLVMTKHGLASQHQQKPVTKLPPLAPSLP